MPGSRPVAIERTVLYESGGQSWSAATRLALRAMVARGRRGFRSQTFDKCDQLGSAPALGGSAVCCGESGDAAAFVRRVPALQCPQSDAFECGEGRQRHTVFDMPAQDLPAHQCRLLRRGGSIPRRGTAASDSHRTVVSVGGVRRRRGAAGVGARRSARYTVGRLEPRTAPILSNGITGWA